jgi:hypothetical protein
MDAEKGLLDGDLGGGVIKNGSPAVAAVNQVVSAP